MAKRITRTSSYYPVAETWVSVVKRGHVNKCCDCGLLHRYYYRIGPDGGIQFRAKRLPRR